MKKSIVSFVLILMFIMTPVFSESGLTIIDVALDSVKIFYNNREITNLKPFIYEGTTYVPLRQLVNFMGKQIEYSGETASISITDTDTNNSVASYKQQLEEKDMIISQLRQKVQSLETGVSSGTTYPNNATYPVNNNPTNNTNYYYSIDSRSLSDLQSSLNSDYGKYKNIRFSITLSNQSSYYTNSIQVQISSNLNLYRTEWNNLTTNNKKSYLQDICNDITRTFGNINIEGYIRNTSTGTRAHNFSLNSSGVVELNSGSGTSSDVFYDLEEDLNNDFYRALDSIRVEIELDGDEDDITYYVYVDYDRYEDEWEELVINNRSRIEGFMDDIRYDISREFRDADIEGYIVNEYNNKNMARYRNRILTVY